MYGQLPDNVKQSSNATQLNSEKLSVSLISFSPHNRNRTVFVPDVVAVALVAENKPICGCDYAVVSFYAGVT